MLAAGAEPRRSRGPTGEGVHSLQLGFDLRAVGGARPEHRELGRCEQPLPAIVRLHEGAPISNSDIQSARAVLYQWHF